MREIKVSVIIPIYNVEEYLEECLQSVVDQTLEDLQVIMVDDGSLDGSTDIAKKFASRYDHFEYVIAILAGMCTAHIGIDRVTAYRQTRLSHDILCFHLTNEDSIYYFFHDFCTSNTLLNSSGIS